jgi:hypothetical protein
MHVREELTVAKQQHANSVEWSVCREPFDIDVIGMYHEEVFEDHVPKSGVPFPGIAAGGPASFKSVDNSKTIGSDRDGDGQELADDVQNPKLGTVY